MKKISKKLKAAIGLSVVILLFFTGVSYSAWSDTLSIRGIFTTANFSVEFGNKNDIEVNLIKTDARDNIKVIEQDIKFSVTKNDNKYISLRLTDNLINELKKPGYMLQIKYPIQASDDSKIKALKPIDADFDKPDESIDAIPQVKITFGDERITVSEEVNESDYKINFKVYRRMETEKDKNIAIVFLEAGSINDTPLEISVEYEYLKTILSETDILQVNSELSAQLNAEYSIVIPILAEQFNNGE